MTASKDSKTRKLAEQAAEYLDELVQGGEKARRLFVTWVTTSPRHLEEAFRMVDLNATLTRMWERKRRPTAVSTDAPSTGYVRKIKRYTNRRLYDTVESCYITISDIRRLVLDRVDFVVINNMNREDITRLILLQVIAEQEQGPQPLMSRDLLLQVIRSYGEAVHGVTGSFLEQSLKLLAGQQRSTTVPSAQESHPESAAPANTLAQTNFARWKQVQDEIYKKLNNAGASI
jgi:polyhydroxyalkanoate synthesis repressor PhaR